MISTQGGTRIAEFFDLGAWATWIAGLDRGFAFLLLLPFVVALVGLWASWNEDDEASAQGDADEEGR